MSTHPQWRQLSIAIIGGGLGGLSAALGLRRQGHKVTIYERADFAGEKGASVSCAANGTRWLREWKCDIPSGDPVILEKLISHDWKTGDPISVVDLADYEERWGDVSGPDDYVTRLTEADLDRSTICSIANTCTPCCERALAGNMETAFLSH
jgi:2-polyprenyl-6-methoxyphenol hydroxylase-like FAD-dependent oxidoreductase